MSIMKNALIICVIFSSFAFGQEEFNFNFDYANFKGQDDYVYVEFYFSIYTQDLKYDAFEGRYKAEFTTEFKLLHQDSVIAAKSWGNVNYVNTLEDIHENQKLFSVNHMYVRPGEYRLVVEARDLHSGSSRRKEVALTVSAFDAHNLCMSDIQFASTIKPDTVQNQYYKNGYQILPNTERFYGIGLPMLMFYAEIYNLTVPDEPDSAHYVVTYGVLNSDQQPLRQFNPRAKLKPGSSTVEVGGFNIITLTSGTYYLQIDVDDSTNHRAISKRAKFFVYRAGDFAETQPSDSTQQMMLSEQAVKLIQGVYQSMTEEEIDNEFGAAAYIATKEEQSIYKTLDANGKRQFMPQFWAKRDQTLQTARNEFRDDYLSRMRAAEKEFRGFKRGWKADEGRILLLYGVPDEIERFPSSNENKAYRLWRYFSIQGGVEFVFVDRRGWGEYELVHSNARGELYDEEWTRWIDPNR